MLISNDCEMLSNFSWMHLSERERKTFLALYKVKDVYTHRRLACRESWQLPEMPAEDGQQLSWLLQIQRQIRCLSWQQLSLKPLLYQLLLLFLLLPCLLLLLLLSLLALPVDSAFYCVRGGCFVSHLDYVCVCVLFLLLLLLLVLF